MKTKPMKVTAEKPNWAQQVYYCPYCSRTGLLYLWQDSSMIGLGLDKWLWCPKCKHKFKMGISGMREQELDVEIEMGDKK